eukprot:g46025.t1
MLELKAAPFIPVIMSFLKILCPMLAIGTGQEDPARAVNDWNSLRQPAVKVQIMSIFKSEIDKSLGIKRLKGYGMPQTIKLP